VVFMNILVTNDDGYDSPGLLALCTALRAVGDVEVVAPERNWTSAGHQRTIDRPLRVRSGRLRDGSLVHISDGSPSDCVILAVMGLLARRPSIVVSGVNRGSNLGLDVLYSGTVAAAAEAVVHGIPGIAVSLADWMSDDFDGAAQVAVRMIRAVERHGILPQTVLNVNVPAIPAARLSGIAITRLGSRDFGGELVERRDPFGAPYYWIAGRAPTGIDEAGTDFAAIAEGKVSVTPLSLDATHAEHLEALASWEL
jgi:5'-nucleotidase